MPPLAGTVVTAMRMPTKWNTTRKLIAARRQPREPSESLLSDISAGTKKCGALHVPLARNRPRRLESAADRASITTVNITDLPGQVWGCANNLRAARQGHDRAGGERLSGGSL